MTELAVAVMASADKSLMPFVGLPKFGWSAWLSGPSGGVDPYCVSLRPKRGLGELILELLTMGPEAPSFLN